MVVRKVEESLGENGSILLRERHRACIAGHGGSGER